MSRFYESAVSHCGVLQDAMLYKDFNEYVNDYGQPYTAICSAAVGLYLKCNKWTLVQMCAEQKIE